MPYLQQYPFDWDGLMMNNVKAIKIIFLSMLLGAPIGMIVMLLLSVL